MPSILNHIFEDGTIYSGEILNKKSIIANGQGKAVLKNKDIYIGQWSSGYITGIGKLIKPNYSTYEGEFEKGKMQGFGMIVFKNAHIVSMKGFWNNNILVNLCDIKYSDGSRYLGLVHNFLRHGFGTFYFPDGSCIKANWVDNELDGEASILKNNNVITCKWNNGVSTNFYKIKYQNGSIYQGKCDPDFCPHDHGTMKYHDGRIYKGFWKNGIRQGYGFYLLPSGDYYNGYWLNDKKHYSGIYFSKLGSHAIQYYWENDVQIYRLRSYYY